MRVKGATEATSVSDLLRHRAPLLQQMCTQFEDPRAQCTTLSVSSSR